MGLEKPGRVVIPPGKTKMAVGAATEKKEVYKMQVGVQMQGRTFSSRRGRHLRGLQGSSKAKRFGIDDGVA